MSNSDFSHEEKYTKIGPLDMPLLEGVSRIEREAFADEGLGPGNLALLARCGSVFALTNAGSVTAEAIVIAELGGAKALLLSLAVDARLRGRGRGKRLLMEILAHISAAGFKQIELTVAPDNKAAISLYVDRLGFVIRERLTDHFGPGHHRLLLEKQLS
ncbi:MAG: GNAT family N-acetyltransferase [Candidatus Riflebacteria bacterium]|nr:GNAT family N-acetyltransferase [Candidatus Riflebacteria bacterium]